MNLGDLQRFAGPLPDDNLVVNDDEVAVKIAVFFGLIDKVSDPKVSGPATVWAIAEHHPTHWITCVRAWRHPDPLENGWSIMATPKKGLSLEKLKADLKAMA